MNSQPGSNQGLAKKSSYGRRLIRSCREKLQRTKYFLVIIVHTSRKTSLKVTRRVTQKGVMFNGVKASQKATRAGESENRSGTQNFGRSCFSSASEKMTLTKSCRRRRNCRRRRSRRRRRRFESRCRRQCPRTSEASLGPRSLCCWRSVSRP